MRVIVVDDHEVVRSGLVALLEALAKLEVAHRAEVAAYFADRRARQDHH